MATVEEITERVRALPAALQEEALHYVEYLLQRQTAIEEGDAWSRASAARLADAYGPDDAVYDSE
ncbi:MAG: DUF2281 domain-containing protein [Planctomycetia bacterium]|nr:DUF2281 domain-containing protein [Planctomycetia bacterium]